MYKINFCKVLERPKIHLFERHYGQHISYSSDVTMLRIVYRKFRIIHSLDLLFFIDLLCFFKGLRFMKIISYSTIYFNWT